MAEKPSPAIDEKTSTTGKVDLPVADFLAELLKGKRGVAFMDANHGDPAMPNFLARNAGALKKAGVARHFDEFPSSNQPMVDAVTKEKDPQKRKFALMLLKEQYNGQLNPVPLNVSKERAVEEYMAYYEASQEAGLEAVNVDAPSLRDLASQAESLASQITKGEKELKALAENAPKLTSDEAKKKSADLKALKEKYEPIKEIPGQFKAIMDTSAKLQSPFTPDKDKAALQQQFGAQVRKARIEVQKYWAWRMNDATKPGEKFSASLGREHFEGGDFAKQLKESVTKGEGLGTVLIIQAPVLKDAIYTGKKENIPFPASGGDLPDYVIVTPSVLLMDQLKKDKVPQARIDAVAGDYEAAGQALARILNRVRDRQNAGTKPESALMYQTLEKQLYNAPYLELSRGQIKDARQSLADLRAWVDAQKTFERDDKEKILADLKIMEEKLTLVNDPDKGIAGVPTPKGYTPNRLMGDGQLKVISIGLTDDKTKYIFSVTTPTGESRKLEVTAPFAQGQVAKISKIVDVTNGKSGEVVEFKPLLVIEHDKADRTYLKAYNASKEFKAGMEKAISGAAKDKKQEKEDKKESDKKPSSMGLANPGSPMATQLAFSDSELPAQGEDAQPLTLADGTTLAAPATGKRGDGYFLAT